jgi:hypothetical protein
MLGMHTIDAKGGQDAAQEPHRFPRRSPVEGA